MGLLARGNKTRALNTGVVGRDVVINQVAFPSYSIHDKNVDSNTQYESVKVSGHASVTVPLHGLSRSKASAQGGENTGGPQKHVTPVSLKQVHSAQFIDNHKRDMLDNVTVQKNDNKGRSHESSLRNNVDYTLLFDVQQFCYR